MATASRRKRKNGRNGSIDLQGRLNSLRADLDALQNDLGGLVSDVGGAASSQMQGVVNGAIDSASDAVDRVNEWGSENLDGVRDAVRTQPLAACVLSMSAGAIIGALLLR